MSWNAASQPAEPPSAPVSAHSRGVSEDQTSQEERSHQQGKYDALVDILVSAGYFRARIPTLDPFDKIIGGLCWCIDTSGEGVDVDILFQEKSKIKEKIKLSEQIVKAVRNMQCPASIQAHQIQGSDWAACYPVVVWLVKKFFQHREATKHSLRKHSEMQFRKGYLMPEDDYEGSADFLHAVNERYRPERRYRRGQRDNDTEDTLVQSCLFEYGERVRETQGDSSANEDLAAAAAAAAEAAGQKVDSKGALSAFERQFIAAKKAADKEDEKSRMEDKQREEQLIAEMASVEAGFASGMASASNIGQLVSLQSDTIQEAAAEYEKETEEMRKALEAMETDTESGKRAELAAFNRRKAAFDRQIKAEDMKAQAVVAKLQAVSGKLNAIQTEATRAEQYNARIVSEEAKLDAIEKNSGLADDLNKLRQLVLLNETLKNQEGDFKRNCKEQLARFEETMKKLKSEDAQDDESARLHEIERMHAEMLAKYNKMRQLVATRNQAIAATSRQIDDVPTRTELIQYERRFVELYEQVAAKLDETRKYFNTYNTLDETHKFLTKEVTLINSISENFVQAMNTKVGKERFLIQLEGIVKGVQENARKQKLVLTEKKQAVADLDSKHGQLLDQQRKYFKAVKDFQEECDKNELLTQKMEALKRERS